MNSLKNFKSNFKLRFAHHINKKFFTDRMIMRDYINRKLYYENEGYYSNINSIPIGRLESPLDFKNMRGIGDYTKELNEKYPKSTWLTGPELLRPYFGYAIGNYILTDFLKKKEKNKTKKNIKIIEIGFGMGGAIDSILEYLKNFSIKNYRNTEYLGFEVTNILHEKTDLLLRKNHPGLAEENKLKLINKSIYDYDFNEESQKFNEEEDECYLLAFNLVNSLPHDRVKIKMEFYQIYNKELKAFYEKRDSFSVSKYNSNHDTDKQEQTYLYKFLKDFLSRDDISQLILENYVNGKNVNSNKNPYTNYSLEYTNLKDDIVKEMLCYYLYPENEKFDLFGNQFYSLEMKRKKDYESWFIKLVRMFMKLGNKDNFVWLPSGVIKFFDFIHRKVPHHKLILLDFDMLPGKIFNCDYSGENSPAVYSIVENSLKSETHSSIFANYENKKKPVNVYFPVDFDLLQLMYKNISGRISTVNKFEYFMMNHSMSEWCETRSGFNPLLDTHHNTSFLLSND